MSLVTREATAMMVKTHGLERNHGSSGRSTAVKVIYVDMYLFAGVADLLA